MHIGLSCKSITYNYKASVLPLRSPACVTRPSPLVGGIWAQDYCIHMLGLACFSVDSAMEDSMYILSSLEILGWVAGEL